MSRITFKVNGVPHSVGCEVNSHMSLLDYIRHTLELRGTKYMCREAGCGACIVAAAKQPNSPLLAVNSCMVPITSCQDWEIETIENLGNRKKGYHVLQKTLAEKNGTQCGYCSPAWIMSMYCLSQKTKNLTMLEIEKSFGSNICRCTGYRPILDAFKKFAIDAPKSDRISDIEDLLVCKKTGNPCSKDCNDDWSIISKDDIDKETVIKLKLTDGKLWFKVNKVNEIFRVLETEGDDSYMLVIGNTAKGVFPIDDYPRVLIDISGVAELKGHTIDQNLIIYAGTTLTELLDITKTVSENPTFRYLLKFTEHLKNVAHIAVRNIGSIGGNLMIKHQHNEFSSDLFVLFETVGAFVTIQNSSGKKEQYSMQQFLKINMRGYVLLNVLLPPLEQDVELLTFKIMPRSQNAHAIVNAGFLYKLKNNYVEQARIVFGGLSSSFIRASATEVFLVGKQLFTNETLQSALKILGSELVVEDRRPDFSVEYRKQLALALFYKSLLILCPESTITPRYRTGTVKIHETRPVSKGLQMYETKPSLWPLNQPIPKVEALIQCAGEAFYSDDMPSFPREVFAAFVLSTVAVGDILSIDPSTALRQPGVISFYTAKDIPGLNSFTPKDNPFYTTDEEVLCSGSVKYYNQPIGIIVAETEHIANTAAKMVYAKYANARKPIIDILVAKNDPNRTILFSTAEAKEKGTDVKKVIKGVNAVYGQYHFTMETLTCVIRPIEEGMKVYCASQWIDSVQLMIARALKLDQNCIDVHTRRVGGGFGIKMSRSTSSAVACALVVSKLNRPCRFIQSLTTNMRAVGKRLPYCSEFEAQVNESGNIQFMDYNIYQDDGYTVNELLVLLSIGAYYNCYKNTRWSEKVYNCITDTAKNTWCRAPATLESIAMAEKIMEQISYEMAIDPLEVRLANLDPKYVDMRDMINTVITKSDYKQRRVAVNKFNIENRWKKRGLRFSLLRWTPTGTGVFEINLSIYHGDGSIVITHGGIEMGQGINTKAVQICAYLLKIPIEKIQIKENNTIIAANTMMSGGSLTSQNVGYGVQNCCMLVLERLEPIRSTMDNPTWEELIKKAFESDVDLQFHVHVGTDGGIFFDVLGVALAEVEVDILTGEFEVIRVDVLEDVGQSVNPEIDVGQVEGAFIMGLGYWTSEQLVYSNTGEILTDRTWNYYVPQARDIPQDFRVYFKRNSYSSDAIQGSKCIGEPPMCLSVVIIFALREAIASARLDSGIPTTQWFSIVGSEVSSDVSLLDYIRHTLELRGTKYMCREAGCGACIVAAAKQPHSPILAVNSCMVPIISCQDWEIVTIEHLGNRNKGYHVLQKTLAENNGTQCGYCTPGWIMSMYSLLQTNRDLTMQKIEQSFASNICRCTGYRSILEAFKKFAKDGPVNSSIPDLEDLVTCHKDCKSTCDDKDWCFVSKDEVDTKKWMKLKDDKLWYQVSTVKDILDIFKEVGDSSYMLSVGNTAKGAYPIDDYPSVLIDISRVTELKGYTIDQNLIIGAGTTLTELMNICQDVSKREDFDYLRSFYDHISLIAHIAVRNIGSIGGNLMIKHEHREFPSDIFILLETVDAQLTLINISNKTKIVTVHQFLKEDMRCVVILNISLPPLCKKYHITTYKIMPRAQNAHAIVNAGFLYKLTIEGKVEEARIAYGGLSPLFSRAKATESYLVGKLLFTNDTLKSALKILEEELTVSEIAGEPSIEYRKQLATALFYKGLLSMCPENQLNERYRSGAVRLHETRPVSNGCQIFETNPSLWPLNQPIPRLEALIQCAGEAEYTEDLPSFPHEVFAAFVLSTVPKGYIVDINVETALAQKGVITFYTAKDIPGVNSFTPLNTLFKKSEEVLSSGEIKYYNQPIGIIVAESLFIAGKAAKMVEIKYSNVKKPVIDVKAAKKDQSKNQLNATSEANDKGNDTAKVIKGGNTIYGQYHFTMENIACVTKPIEEGLAVYATSQWMDAMQIMISEALNIDQNRIDIHVRRLGGGYGIKLSRSIQVAVACSLVVQKLNRPCRFIQPLTTTTRAVGKRLPCSTDFEVGVDNSGTIQYLNYNLYEDNGYTINETLTKFGFDVFNNCYSKSRWNYKCFDTITDTAKNTLCRAPGSLETTAMAEFIMEQISYELSLDPLEVRFKNLDPKFNDLKEMVESLIIDSEYYTRKLAINKYNIENRWKKRGLRFSFLRWKHVYPRYFDINLNVYHGDGTIAITHGGIEMGQGINTKAAQVCAYTLKIPMNKIQIKANDTIIAPNSNQSGGTLTSQNIAIGVRKCCQELLKRLEPIKDIMDNPTWEELITKAFESDVDLQVHGFINSDDTEDYDIFGVALAEVEVDILTGESEILRVDLIEDVGQSLSPMLDIGQMEGAFIMGLGYWTSEQLIYDPNSGELLTDRTWNYHVPQARDIPQDFRIYFRKNAYNKKDIFGSKATGEPPICMSVVVPIAIREAIASARSDSGIPTTNWFSIDGPYTVENICLAASTRTEDFKFS